MKCPKFKLINGERDQLEIDLANALFGDGTEEIDRRIALLDATEKDKPQLTLTPSSKPINSET